FSLLAPQTSSQATEWRLAGREQIRRPGTPNCVAPAVEGRRSKRQLSSERDDAVPAEPARVGECRGLDGPAPRCERVEGADVRTRLPSARRRLGELVDAEVAQPLRLGHVGLESETRGA